MFHALLLEYGYWIAHDVLTNQSYVFLKYSYSSSRLFGMCWRMYFLVHHTRRINLQMLLYEHRDFYFLVIDHINRVIVERLRHLLLLQLGMLSLRCLRLRKFGMMRLRLLQLLQVSLRFQPKERAYGSL